MNFIQQRIKKNLRVHITSGHVCAPCFGIYLKAKQTFSDGLHVKVLTDCNHLITVPAASVETLNDLA